MKNKFKDKLFGDRITLKRTIPNLKMAKEIFSTIDKNREHLRPWLPWEEPTKKVEDTLKYLFEKEKETESGKKIEYGIFVGKKYAGNIAMFKIDDKHKSGEIGYWIASEFAGNGYATEAVKVIEKEFFNDFNLNRIVIKCDNENTPSSKVAEKCGYILEGRLREVAFNKHFNNLKDMLIFSKLKSEYK